MRTEIWAHRGASAAAPENTMAAFELAIQQGADGIELDVHLSADRIIVVTHDESCRRVTGENKMVCQLKLDELRQLDFGRVMPGFGRQQIPTLEEVFDLVKPTDLTLNIELKNSLILYPGLEEAVLNLARDHQMTDRICLSSFNHYSMVQAASLIKEQNLSVPCGLLYDCGLYEPWVYARHAGASAIHPHYGNLRIPDLVEACNDAGVKIHVWTVDAPDQIKKACLLGVDAIITNVPGEAVAICKKTNWTL